MQNKLEKIKNHSPLRIILATAVLASTGALVWAQAVRPHIKIEAENSIKSDKVADVSDASASGGQAIRFGDSSGGWDPRQTLPPGSNLPSDSTCAARVVDAPEIRPQLASRNSVAGHNKNLGGTYKSRVSGAFTGSTDEILQWVACKWGIDVDLVRAQAAKESWWTFGMGDWSTNPSACPPAHPPGADGRPGECPESYGILQVRWLYHGPPADLNTWPEVETSTAYNADYTYSVWRECFEGDLWWLNTVDRGEEYVAGDAWGCTGVWFSGRWMTQPALDYMADLRDYYDQKIWTTQPFINFRN